MVAECPSNLVKTANLLTLCKCSTKKEKASHPIFVIKIIYMIRKITKILKD